MVLGISNWNAWKLWNRSNIVNSFGDPSFEVTRIPFATTYGVGGEKHMTLSSFLKYMESNSSQIDFPGKNKKHPEKHQLTKF